MFQWVRLFCFRFEKQFVPDSCGVSRSGFITQYVLIWSLPDHFGATSEKRPQTNNTDLALSIPPLNPIGLVWAGPDLQPHPTQTPTTPARSPTLALDPRHHHLYVFGWSSLTWLAWLDLACLACLYHGLSCLGVARLVCLACPNEYIIYIYIYIYIHT